MVSDLEIAYVAGLFDGEGCVSIRHSKPAGKYKSHAFGVNITNTHLGVLEWVKERFGGTIGHQKRTNPKHNERHCWSLSGEAAAEFLRIVKPYLVIKVLATELGLLFAETYKPHWKVRQNRISDAGRLLRERLTTAIQAIQ